MMRFSNNRDDHCEIESEAEAGKYLELEYICIFRRGKENSDISVTCIDHQKWDIIKSKLNHSIEPFANCPSSTL